MQVGAATVENSVEIPQKIKNEIALWLSNYTGDVFKETWNTDFERTYAPLCSLQHYLQ